MASDLLPLFPLQAILFPRTTMPLHIFEARYKRMIGEAINESSEFGIVLAQDRGVVNTGCTAIISKVMKKYDDGRLDILISGRRRFEVYSLNQDMDYLRGEVSFFDDEDLAPPVKAHLEHAIRGYYACRLLEGAATLPDPDLNDPQLSFQLAQAIPDTEFRQAMLSLRSEAERLKQLARFFPPYISKQKQLDHFRKIVPQNGHGKLKDHE